MPRARRSTDWGFPRWRPYEGAGRTPEAQRPCDRAGCPNPGICPAPKAPNRPERWYFCEAHAAEYNRQWNYFDALSEEEARAQAEAEQRGSRAYERAKHWAWGEGDGSRSRAELDALRLFELPPDADEAQVKAAHRRMAKANHPDLNPGDSEAAQRFQAAQAAYEVLRAAAERRQATA
jgi:hypothetical protein